MELTGYWWPQVAANYSNNPPQGPRGSHCSGFVATGSATRDGKPVIAHESFDDFGVDNTSTFAKKFTQLMVMPLRCKPFLATSIQ